MTKGKHGNKEAKKPKQSPAPATPAVAATMVPVANARAPKPNQR